MTNYFTIILTSISLNIFMLLLGCRKSPDFRPTIPSTGPVSCRGVGPLKGARPLAHLSQCHATKVVLNRPTGIRDPTIVGFSRGSRTYPAASGSLGRRRVLSLKASSDSHAGRRRQSRQQRVSTGALCFRFSGRKRRLCVGELATLYTCKSNKNAELIPSFHAGWRYALYRRGNWNVTIFRFGDH